MLLDLVIRHFAVIDELRLSLHSGLNVLSGETGAGKSIVVDAVSLLVGERADSTLVRSGEEQAVVEGLFALPPLAVTLLQQWEMPADGDQVLVTREVGREGRSLARLNGRPLALKMLKELGSLLVDIHGQSEHLSLLRTPEHRDILDRYGGLLPLRSEVGELVASLIDVRRRMTALAGDERELARRVDLLEYQVQEIHAARLRVDEEEELQNERQRVAQAETLVQAAEEAYRLVYRGEGGPAIVDLMARVQSAAATLGRLDPTQAASLAGEAEELAVRLEELARTVRQYREGLEFEPRRVEEIEERLDLLFHLKRKYGASVAEVLTYGERAAAELAELQTAGETLQALLQEEDRLLRAIGEAGAKLSPAREAVGRRLAEGLEEELADLAMARTRFAVAVEQADDPQGAYVDGRRLAFDGSGFDRVEFRLSPNPGEELRPLARIASGGEQSRIMLALKAILSEADEIPTLIFDEIDQGIGGRTGAIVGQKLSRLAARHQVLCVTHLPQLAAYADAHYRVEKRLSGGRTHTLAQRLSPDEIVTELESMLGTRAPETARSLLADARAWKQRQGLAGASA